MDFPHEFDHPVRLRGFETKLHDVIIRQKIIHGPLEPVFLFQRFQDVLHERRKRLHFLGIRGRGRAEGNPNGNREDDPHQRNDQQEQ